ncbi:triose-phosphate isomerase [Helicobacter pylori]|nr:triose-phosphate isomerase [Helicobacter pylori]
MLNQKTPLLYGGSVNAQNAKEILGIDSVDGLLIGSASLELENFKTIISFL